MVFMSKIKYISIAFVFFVNCCTYGLKVIIPPVDNCHQNCVLPGTIEFFYHDEVLQHIRSWCMQRYGNISNQDLDVLIKLFFTYLYVCKQQTSVNAMQISLDSRDDQDCAPWKEAIWSLLDFIAGFVALMEEKNQPIRNDVVKTLTGRYQITEIDK